MANCIRSPARGSGTTRAPRCSTPHHYCTSYLRLIERGELKVENRAHFLAYATHFNRLLDLECLHRLRREQFFRFEQAFG